MIRFIKKLTSSSIDGRLISIAFLKAIIVFSGEFVVLNPPLWPLMTIPCLSLVLLLLLNIFSKQLAPRVKFLLSLFCLMDDCTVVTDSYTESSSLTFFSSSFLKVVFMVEFVLSVSLADLLESSEQIDSGIQPVSSSSLNLLAEAEWLDMDEMSNSLLSLR